ncbi:MAG: hypothetical protein GC164_03575 [Phycisphaera sp.]|nr:hypothetical protein [Phycisphaera sp.]
MPHTTDHFAPGTQVTLTQQVPHGNTVWTTRITGKVVRYEQKKTGSWFAHAKDDKLWLDRLVIQKPDGELVMVNLDQYTHVESTP